MWNNLLMVYTIYGNVIAKKDIHVPDVRQQQLHAAFAQQTLIKSAWDLLVPVHSVKIVHQEAHLLLAQAVAFAL